MFKHMSVKLPVVILALIPGENITLTWVINPKLRSYSTFQYTECLSHLHIDPTIPVIPFHKTVNIAFPWTCGFVWWTTSWLAVCSWSISHRTDYLSLRKFHIFFDETLAVSSLRSPCNKKIWYGKWERYKITRKDVEGKQQK